MFEPEAGIPSLRRSIRAKSAANVNTGEKVPHSGRMHEAGRDRPSCILRRRLAGAIPVELLPAVVVDFDASVDRKKLEPERENNRRPGVDER